MSDIIANLVIIVKEPTGCRFIQNKLHELIDLINTPIYQILENHFIELSINASGNFFIQKLLELFNENTLKKFIYKYIKKNFYLLAVHPYGTRVIQKLIDITLDKINLQQALLIMIKEHILKLMLNPNGIHIIHKLVITLHIKSQFVYDCIYEHILNISIDKIGCCIIQKCFEAGNSIQKSNIINLVLNYSRIFMTDQYANFILQYVIFLQDQFFLNNFILCFKNNFLYLCKQKYSSNILEKVKINKLVF